MDVANGICRRTASTCDTHTSAAEAGARTARIARPKRTKATAVFEGTSDTEDDAHAHRCSENPCHAGDDRLDGVGIIGGGHDKVEEDIGEVDEENGAVQIEVITKHESPGGERFGFEGLEGPHDGERKGCRVKDGGSKPVDTDPALVVQRSSNASLAIEEMDGAVETAADRGDNTLDEQERKEQ